MRYDTWEDVANSGFKVSLDYLNRIQSGNWPEDAFSLGQMISKLYLVRALKNQVDWDMQQGNVFVLGCWFGQLAPLLVEELDFQRIYGFDSDPAAIQLSEEFCEPEIRRNWRFKGVVADINLMDWGEPEFEIDGELITDKPTLIINTSTEHMTDDWYNTVSPGTWVALQGNSDPALDGHINTADSLSEWSDRYTMTSTVWRGEIVLPTYTRYMKIGIR